MQRMNRCGRALMAACVAVGPGVAGVSGQTRPTTRPSSIAASQPTTAGASVVLNFKDAPLDAVLDYLSKNLGFEVIKDGPIDARVNISSRQPVSADDAIALVNAALKANGYIAIRDGRILKVTPRDKAKKGNPPVHFGNNPDQILDTDEVITQVIPVQNVNAAKLKDELKPFMPDADVSANEGSNSLIITDTSAGIRRIVQIIAKLDEHEAQTAEIRIVRLKHANASTTAKLIETFFKPPATGGGPPNPNMPQMMPPQPGQPGQGAKGGSERHGQTVVTAADDRTNTLLVMASTASLKTIDDIIQHIDADEVSAAQSTQMKVFPLKYAVADDTAKLINTVFKAPKNNDDFPFFIVRFGGGEEKKQLQINAAADPRTNTLIVTGSEEGIAEVGKLIETLDANPLASAELQVYHLKHADAYDVSKLIEDMFKPKDDSGPRFPFFIFGENPSPAQAGKLKVNVTADDRTNTLIVTAPGSMMQAIGRIVEELDADPATEDSLFIYHLRNAQAQNLEYVLNVMFGNISGGQNPNGGPNGQNPNGPNGQNQPNRFQNNNTNNSFENGPNSNNGNNQNPNGRNNRQNRYGQQGANPNLAKAYNDLTGKVLVVADPDTNALLVTTASKYEKQVRKIIEDLDRPVPQVLIKVLVAEVTHDNSADLGMDFSVLNQRAGGKGQTAVSSFGNAGATPGVVVSVVESNITAMLHALATQDKLDVLSRPYILASDNQLANIFIGSTVPFITNSQITDAGQLINTVQYRDIGLNLNVTPHINPDGLVILDVNPEVQQLTAQTIQLTNNTSSPVISKRSAESRIGVLDGQTVVIGGLMEDRKTSQFNRIPILGDIPVLGALFGRVQTTKTKTELLIFLTPHVAQRADALEPMSKDDQKSMRLTPRAVEPGTFEEQMRGMERGHVPQTQPTQPASPVNSIDLSEPPDKRPTRPVDLGPSTQPALPR
jgi:type II secretion system protein D